MLMIILALVLAGLVIAAGQALVKAPSEQKAAIGLALVVLAGAGAVVGYMMAAAGTDERTFYPIAGAIGGVMVAFVWISRKQKTWPKPGGPPAAR